MAYIWQLSAVQLGGKTWVAGTVLSGKEGGHSSPSSIIGNTARILRSYFRPTYSKREIYIKTDTATAKVRTSRKGHFSVIFDLPSDSGIEMHTDKGEELAIPQDYPAFFQNTASPVEVISDLDDTVLLSHTASLFKRIGTILFVLPRKRKPVVFTYELFQHFQGLNFRITYLSKSESNLFSLIAGVLRHNRLPAGPLLLTPYLRFRQLFNPKKGKDYKLRHLQTFMDNMPHKRFILLGDDTQRDMEVYTEIAKQYPSQVLMVYIRQTGFGRSERQQELWEKLADTNVNAMYFNDGDSADEALIRLDSLIEEED